MQREDLVELILRARVVAIQWIYPKKNNIGQTKPLSDIASTLFPQYKQTSQKWKKSNKDALKSKQTRRIKEFFISRLGEETQTRKSGNIYALMCDLGFR